MSDAPAPQPGPYQGFGSKLNEAAASRGGCWVLHGVVLPDKSTDIDHLVIGPAGVTAIDSRARTAEVEVDGMSRRINRVHTELARAGRDEVRVTGVICTVTEDDGMPARGLADIRGVKVGHPDAAIQHALRDGPIDVATIEIVQRKLATAFAVHGGAQAPPTAPATRKATTPARSPRRPKPSRRAHKRVLAVLAGIVTLAAVAVSVGGVTSSVPRVTKLYRPFTRDDLRALRPDLRAAAVRRAHGPIRGPKLRVTSGAYVLTYRRGRHCRVVITVPRAWPVLGGGKPTTKSMGCSRPRR